MRVGLVIVAGMLIARSAAAESFVSEPLELRDAAAMPACAAAAGALCVRPAAAGTVAIASLPTASLTATAGAHVPTFARRADGVTTDGAVARADDAPWSLDVVFHLCRNALAGNAVFLVYDAEDPTSIAAREPIALWQAQVAAGRTVAARLTLGDDDGFRAGHTYRVRLVQLISGRELLLAEGDVSLR